MSDYTPMIESAESSRETHTVMYLSDDAAHVSHMAEIGCLIVAEILPDSKVMLRLDFIRELKRLERMA